VGAGIRASGVPRGEIFLVTKVSHEYLKADAFARSVDESLKNLQVDYVDMLHVHWPSMEKVPLAETMGALQGETTGTGTPHRRRQLQHRTAGGSPRRLPEPLATLQANITHTSTRPKC